MAPFFALALISFLSLSTTLAEDRAHGLSSEPPVAVSPEAFTFFHPDAKQPSATNPCDSSHCSTLPLAATVKSAPAQESQSQRPTTGGAHGLGAGGIAGISLSFVFVALAGIGVYHVMNKRKANLERAKSEQLGEV